MKHIRKSDKLHIVSPDEAAVQKRYTKLLHDINSGRGMKAYILTFGCQQNEADSEILAGMLSEMGYEMQSKPEGADVVLVNTCAVREHAELKALSLTGQLKHVKAHKPDMLIGMCGCMVSQEHRLSDVKNKYPYVDFAFGTGMVYRLPEVLYNALNRPGRQIEFYNESTLAEGLPQRRESSFKAWVSIMYGCDNFCSYCVVPFVRGRERSRDRDKILAEVKQLADAGYKEITLLGQNVNSYGKGSEDSGDFSDLLNDICKIDGDFMVRFMTSHPKDCTHKLLDTMAANKKIAKQLHLPVQSGSNRILELMNRRYTREHYLSLVEYARSLMPDIALSTDIIVGFPGETEEDFCDTLDILSKVRYDNIYSFIYSKRAGTRAAEMEDQIPPEVQSARFERLLALQNSISLEKNSVYTDGIERVLVECVSKSDPTKLTGRNEKSRLVHFASDDHNLIGQWVNVRITKAETYALLGELVK
nr:tRNA (N6-isopentenyl adenosine(37)-C2)-methylthiotransferase MiaB [Clostridia bacterium]